MSSAPLTVVEKLSRLRTLMRGASIQALLIPTEDAHANEYIHAAHQRRVFITGFTGSAGTAIVTNDQALVWTDGRYHLQAEQQLDQKHWTLMKAGVSGVPSITDWLVKVRVIDDLEFERKWNLGCRC